MNNVKKSDHEISRVHYIYYIWYPVKLWLDKGKTPSGEVNITIYMMFHYILEMAIIIITDCQICYITLMHDNLLLKLN